MTVKTLKKIKMEIICPPKAGEIVEGQVINRAKSALFLDLGPKGIGVILGREFFESKNALKNLKSGDKIMTKIVALETDDGFRELSLVGANQEMAWKELAIEQEKQTVFEVQVHSANKGGLICFLSGIQGFLPTSQLLPEHFPKVEGADPSKIAFELQKLVGSKIKVRIFDLNPAENKLILSEKATKREEREEKMLGFKAGETVQGEISGVTNFGAFLVFEDGLEGLVPASEMPENSNLKVGQKVKAKITEIANNKIYLSLKI
ncbi:MAG: S1 RNA-binding domain-containing protein [Candidatus Pacebacteria bacterium]|nr:S1 RNA-binding domain-containing protein [Candidatus Paceibacterota bacterium]